ncbi:WD repeat-containing protein 43 [Iris pallida]|uniref:WD repeat-containing protein 43 n=1 Tax=Iris pallida TaxID=29817 RepID=A0AAX6F9A9_IRIPA|nr:WD repeat-containing protein 43 [Iris pallida]
MSSPNLRDLLTSFSPSSDFFAVASADGRIKIWDALKGQLQTEFADIASSSPDDDDEALGGARSERRRGHLAVDYKCMKWVQLKPKKKKKKADSSLLVLGTGSGDVLALDVSLGQLKWKVCDCHPGGVTAISFSRHTSCIIYTAGVDGMVCQIDSSTGSMVGKFKSSRKAISALCISADGKLIATAASQLKIFDCSNNKKIKKFSGHPVSVRCAIFSEDGKYILSSAVGERYIAIWKMDGGKKQSASCVLALEHPAIILDMKGSDSESSEVVGLYVLAISEAGLCYFWYGSNIEALQNSKPTKLALSSGSLSRNNKGLAIFAAKFDSVAQPASTPVLVAYGTLIKPLFEKLMVQYGEDMNLEASQDGVLVSTSQSYISYKGHMTLNKVTALDRANAEDAILPLPKLYVCEKKRMHDKPPVIGDVEKGADAFVSKMDKSWPARAEGYPKKIEEKDVTCVEDKLRAAGILGGMDDLVIGNDHRSETVQNDSDLPVDANAPTKKIRSHIMSLSSDDAYKLLDILASSWKSRSATSKHALSWLYFILVIHGQFIMSQESSKKLIGSLQKMTRLRCAAIQPLLNLSGRLQLIMAQIDKAGKNIVQAPLGEHLTDHSEDEEDEDESIDELVYGEEDASQSDSSDDN